MGKHNISIDEKLWSEINDYCKQNALKVGPFCEELLRKFFMREKYGDIPFGVLTDEPENRPAPVFKEEPSPPKEVGEEPMEKATNVIKVEETINPRKRRL